MIDNIRNLKPVLIMLLFLSGREAYAFSCNGPQGHITSMGGEMDVTISAAPEITPGANIVFDLSTQISCKNDNPKVEDYAWPSAGTIFSSKLSSQGFTGGVLWNGSNYLFPITSWTARGNKWKMPHPKGNYYYLPLKVYMSPVGVQGGVKINAGEALGTVFLLQSDSLLFPRPETFKFNIFTKEDIVIPTGGCDVNSYNNLVALDSKLPSEFSNYAKDVGLSIKCATPKNVTYSIKAAGRYDAINKTFLNASASNPASGVAIQLLTRTNEVVENNKVYPVGQVNNSFQTLGLKARYVATGQPFQPGNVEANMTVIFSHQ